MLRHRISLVNSSTTVKSRVHAILDKHNLRCDHNVFCRKGWEWLEGLCLPQVDRSLLDANLRELQTLRSLIDEADRGIADMAARDPRVELLMGFTGIDYYLAMVILYEIGEIRRFSNPRKLVSWVGSITVPVWRDTYHRIDYEAR
mgnify:CR=1 FL=1